MTVKDDHDLGKIFMGVAVFFLIIVGLGVRGCICPNGMFACCDMLGFSPIIFSMLAVCFSFLGLYLFLEEDESDEMWDRWDGVVE